RAGVGGNAARSAHADLRLLRHAQPLAYAVLARKGRGSGDIHATRDHYARAALARAPALCGAWARVPGALQVVSGRGGRAFPGRGAVRRAQRVARQLGGARGGVALVESLEAPLWKRRAKGDARCLAVGASSRLARAS